MKASFKTSSKLRDDRFAPRATGILFGLLAALVATSSTQATNPSYWDGTGTGWESVGSWSNAANVTTDPSVIPGISDVATFNISTVNTAQTVNLNGAQSALGLAFGTTGTVLIQGGGTNQTLTLAGSGIAKTGTGAITIGSATTGQQVALALSANQTWANNSTLSFH